jgi:general secretion pathway protein A
MRVAGGRPEIFSQRAIRKLYRLSRGVPRLINIVADRALLAAYATDQSRIEAGLIGKAANEVFGRTHRLRWWPWAATATGLALLLSGFLIDEGNPTSDAPVPSVAETAGRPDAAGNSVSSPSAGSVPETGPEKEAVLDDTVLNPVSNLASLTDLLAAGETSSDATTAALFELWGAAYSPAAGPACEQARLQQLRCLTLVNSSIGELRVLNRPVGLELLTSTDQQHHVLLAGLGEKHAVVWVGDAMERIDIADLTLFTYGQQLLLFRPAITDEAGSLTEGARGPGVIWLRTSLASILGKAIETGEPDLFDAGLKASVMDYQRARGLFVDGVVGDRTLINLQSDIGLVGVSLKSGMH